MLRFLGLLFVATCLVAGLDLSTKPDRPTAAWCAGVDEASIFEQTILRVWMGRQSFHCQDWFVCRTAHCDGLDLIQVPFTGGLWFKM